MTDIEVPMLVKDTHRDMRKDHKYEYSIYSLAQNGRGVEIDRRAPTDGLANRTSFEKFTESLPEENCRYAIYDYRFLTKDGEGNMSKLIFILWSPDDALCSEKEAYGAGKSSLRRQLSGISFELYISQLEDLTFEAVRHLVGL